MRSRIDAEAVVPPILGLCIAVYLMSEQLLGRFSQTTTLYVFCLGISIVILSAVILWSALRGDREALPAEDAAQDRISDRQDHPKGSAIRLLIFLAMIVALILTLDLLGYLIGFSVFLIVSGWILGTRSLPVLLGISIGGMLLIHFAFVEWLAVPLPEGLLEGLL